MGVFKSFKENFHKACHQLCKGGGVQLVTDQDITDLFAETLPVTVSPLYLMSANKHEVNWCCQTSHDKLCYMT